MRRRPPISTRTDTCFPYTTLFRSSDCASLASLPDARRPHRGAGACRTFRLGGAGEPLRLAILSRKARVGAAASGAGARSEEHTSELQSLMRISYAVFCLKKKKPRKNYPYVDKST